MLDDGLAADGTGSPSVVPTPEACAPEATAPGDGADRPAGPGAAAGPSALGGPAAIGGDRAGAGSPLVAPVSVHVTDARLARGPAAMEIEPVVPDGERGGPTGPARPGLAAPLPTASIDTAALYLKEGYWDWSGEYDHSFNMSSVGTAAKNGTLHYNYSGFSGISGAGTDTDGLSAARKALVDDAFDYLGEVLGIDFVQTTSTSTATVDIFFKDNASGAFANTDLAGSGLHGDHRFVDYGWVNINSGWSGGTSDINDYTYQTIVHEILHVLGLGHQGSYNGSAVYITDTTQATSNNNVYLNDSWQMSIMSYFDQVENTNIDADFNYVITGMQADWEALRDYYGSSAFTGSTTYGFNTNISAAVSEVMADLSLWADETAFCIIDDGGIDTLDFSGYADDQRIDLRVNTGTQTSAFASNIGGETGNMTIAVGTVIENVVSGAGDDSLFGNSSDNTIEGGGGDDAMYAYGGNDTFRYSNGQDGNSDALYGGTETDRILVDGSGFYDLRDTNVGSIEEIEFAADGTNVDKTVYISNKELDGSDEFAAGLLIDGNASSGADDTLEVHLDFVSDVDISGWTFQDWNSGSSGTDRIEIYGSSSANTVVATGEDDYIATYGGNDSITGGNGDDTIYGGDGNDTVNGGLGSNSIFGELGNDTVFWGPPIPASSDARVHDGGDGTDTINGATAFGGGALFNLGTGIYTNGSSFTETWLNFENYTNAIAGAEEVIGSSGSNVITTAGGANILRGEGGADTLNAGGGTDQLFGGLSADLLNGGDGDDTLEGGFATDTVNGEGGNDLIRVLDGEFFDNVYGGTGTDTLDHGAVTRSGDTFDFELGQIVSTFLTGGTATLAGIEIYRDGSGGNTIVSAANGNTLYGNDGDDTMVSEIGLETMYGGNGRDMVDHSRFGGNYVFDMVTGLTNSLGELYAEFEDVRMGAGNDSVTGTGLANTIHGGGGNDSIDAGNASDSVEGDEGADTIFGNAGNDRILGEAGEDVITGGDGGDSLFGGADTDTVSGGGGNDYIAVGYGEGIDVTDGGTGNDTLDYSGTGGAIVFDMTTGAFSYNGIASSATLFEFYLDGDGSGTITGSAFANTITGHGGDDSVVGGGGNDSVTGDAGTDDVNGGGGNDRIAGGADADTLKGGAGSDTLDGGGGDDLLQGGGQLDVLIDGDGKDRLTGDAAADTFDLGTDAFEDTVTDYNDAQDLIRLVGQTFAGLTFTDVAAGRVRIGYGTDSLLVRDTAGTLTAADFDAADFVFV